MNKVFLVFLSFIVIKSNGQDNLTEKYYRQIMYNHVSPQIPIVGIHEINEDEAQNSSHYIFKYNDDQKIVEIINNHYEREEQYPLTTMGAYKTVITYTNNSEIRVFYDPNGKRTTNNKGVYKEKYMIDNHCFKYDLVFYDLDNRPMESNWNVALYKWVKNKDMVVERRYNLDQKLMNFSPYLDFGITGIVYNEDNIPEVNYNLDENLKIKENVHGVACFKDKYDKNGNHRQFSYYNKKGQYVNNKLGFSIGEKEYDERGNLTSIAKYDDKGGLIDIEEIPINLDERMAETPTATDSMDIKEVSLGYLLALKELNPNLMKEVLNENLAKRTLGFNKTSKTEIIKETSYDQMLVYAKTWNKSGTKFLPDSEIEVKILDIYDHTASVKLISKYWVEYLHLIKTNNKWSIVNLLWQYKNINHYPKISPVN